MEDNPTYWIRKGRKQAINEFAEKIIEEIGNSRMYADMDEDDFWATSTISPTEANKRAKYQEELIPFIDKIKAEMLGEKEE